MRTVPTQPRGRPNVLVVDDETDVADAYAMQLSEEYDTDVAYGGEACLEQVSEETAAVLLDRRMPDIHGDDVLDEIRARGYDCTVIMVTAVDPDLNILEMDFDDYLCKPVDRETLSTTLSQYLDTESTDIDPRMEEFFSLLSKLNVLEKELSPAELKNDEEFNRLKQEAVELSSQLREDVDNFEELVETHQAVARGT